MSDIKTKFINDPENITAELLEGYVLAYPNQVKLAAENIVVRANPKGNDKVAIVTLGGSGHEPALSGFVGEGMLDCSVVGDVFAAPGAQRLFQALQLMDREAGILLVVLNHSGDVMSANMACQLAARKGIKVKKLLTHDDISAGIGANIDDRRGLAGCVPLYKILGAAAEEGKSLDELIDFDINTAEIQEMIKKSGEKADEKINWTNEWGKKYPILLTYQGKVNIPNYAYRIKIMLDELEQEYKFNAQDAMLVFKDILYNVWKERSGSR